MTHDYSGTVKISFGEIRQDKPTLYHVVSNVPLSLVVLLCPVRLVKKQYLGLLRAFELSLFYVIFTHQ